MVTITIPKEKVLTLIKKDTCTYYDYTNYITIEINIVFDSYSRLEEFESSSILYITFKDLSILLFERLVRVSEELLLVVD
jgi:hypothetical protein